MSEQVQEQTLGFQTEAKQLLRLMIHSMYSNKEIFLRELISNASDAIDKLRFEAIAEPSLYGNDSDLHIIIDADKEANTITISDNGIGMNHDEVIQNLGTIARSGTAEFIKNLSGDQQKDSQMIGQFGVGFYSAFIVADKVEVFSRRADSEQGVHWSSTGEADFTVGEAEQAERGTRIVLHLKSDHKDFADAWRIKSVIKKYSDHISVPVLMLEQPLPEYDDDGKPKENPEAKAEYKPVNTAKALWTRSRSEIKDEEYQEFYKHISHDFEVPLSWSHNRVEGKLEYTSLLFLPKKAPFDLYQRDMAKGLKLYVQRIFIMDDAEQFLPLYLRFVKGIVDSNDLPLNVSREILQQDKNVDTIKNALTKRVLDMLDKMAAKEPDLYQSFWNEFGSVLKEGPAEDFGNKDKLTKLLRFASTHTDAPVQNQSLAAYVERMKPGQNKIYYVIAENFATAKNSPHLEALRKKGIEVLLLSDRVDEWTMSYLQEFDGKPLQDVGKGQLDLGELDTDADKKAIAELKEAKAGLTERVKTVLADAVDEVRVTDRLTTSPACLVVGDHDMGLQMRRIMEAAGQNVPNTKPSLELNATHPLLERLEAETDDDRFADLARILLGQAQLSEGGQLDDPASFVHKLNELLLRLAG